MQNLVFEKLTQTLTANYEWKILIAGDYFRIVACNYAVDITLIKDGRQIGKMKGMLAGDRVEGQDYDGVIINNGANQQDVTIQISGGGVGSDRVIGEVSVIDGGKFRTLSGVAMIGFGVASAVAAAVPKVQLWNTSTTKNLIIESMLIASSSSQSYQCIKNASLLSNFYGFPVRKDGVGLGSASSSFRQESTAGVNAGDLVLASWVSSTAPSVINFREPIVIRPSQGILINGTTVNTDLTANFEFYEDLI